MFSKNKVINKYKVLFKNMKLKQKIAVSTVSILLLSTVLTISLLYGQFEKIVEKNSYNETHQMVVQLANYYNEKLTKVINLTHDIFENRYFEESLDNILWTEQYNYAKESSTMQAIFQRTKLKDRIIDSFFLYTPKGIFYDNTQKLRPEFDIKNTVIYNAFDNRTSISWERAYRDELFENENRVIPVVMNVTTDRIYDYAFFVVNLSEKEFISSLRDINTVNKASVYVVDREGKLVTSAEYRDYKDLLISSEFGENLKDDNNGHFEYALNGEKLYVNYAQIDLNGWRVVTVQPQKELLRDVQKLQFFVILIGVVLVTFAAVLAVVVASSVTRPIDRLRKTMQLVQEGQLDARFTSRYTDEIGQLGTSFNSMLGEIQQLIKELEEERERTKEEQRLKVKAEIKALQAQINPHFLYNTLDTIYWKAKMGENELVSEMIISLSNLLRIGLSKGRDKIPVTAEIEHVKNYLYLQSNVYKDRFDYTLEIKDDISKYYTVKLLLQPIVENALLHGFENIDYKGHITITIEVLEEKIYLRVTDNGKGFNVADIGASLKDPTAETKGYALKNVYQRVVLNYGEDYGINLESKPYEKTTIEIIIPAEEE